MPTLYLDAVIRLASEQAAPDSAGHVPENTKEERRARRQALDAAVADHDLFTDKMFQVCALAIACSTDVESEWVLEEAAAESLRSWMIATPAVVDKRHGWGFQLTLNGSCCSVNWRGGYWIGRYRTFVRGNCTWYVFCVFNS